MKKICTKCKKRKLLSEFPYKGANRKGLRAWCKFCKNKEARKYRAKVKKQNPEQYTKTNFKQNIKSKYGLTIDDYNKLFQEQNGCCAVCGKHQSEIILCVEHRHSDGLVRGLVCKTCNHLIDIYETDFYGLKEEIVEYMGKHNEQ